MDPEQPITKLLLYDIAVALALHEEVPPRLLWRALEWAGDRISTLEKKVDGAKKALEEGP